MNGLLIILMTGTAAFAALFLKRASGALSLTGGFARALGGMIRSNWLWLGGALYVVSALLNIWLLRRLPYSLVVPCGAVSYVWTMILSRAILKERITLRKILGVMLIVAGVACVAL